MKKTTITHYLNATVCRVHNKRFAISNHKKTDGIVIDFWNAEKQDEKLLKVAAFSENVRGNLVQTKIALSHEAMQLLFVSYSGFLKQQNEKK